MDSNLNAFSSSDKQPWEFGEVMRLAPLGNAQDAVGLFYYENPGQLSLEELSKKLSGNSGIRYNLYSSRTHIKMADGTTAYYYDDYFCEPSICQAYSWSYEGRTFFLVNYPQSTPDQQLVFTKIFSSLRNN